MSMVLTFIWLGLEGKALLCTWWKALPNFVWVGLPAAALVGGPAVDAVLLLLLVGERAIVNCLWQDESYFILV